MAAKVVRSSGYESFDKAARKIFKRALTLPPPPPEMPGDPLTFDMAVTFDLHAAPGQAQRITKGSEKVAVFPLPLSRSTVSTT